MSTPAESVSRQLDRWVEHGLITADQADAIRRFERAEAPPVRLPPVAEAAAYLGILLAVAAAYALWTQLAEDEGDPTRLWLSGGFVLVLLLVGWAVGRGEERATRRLGATLWLLAAIAAGFVTLDGYRVATDGGGLPDVTTLAVGVAGLIVGGGTYLLRREAATQVAAFLGLVVTLVGLPVWLIDDPETHSWAIVVALLSAGAAWLGLDAQRRLPPSRVGAVLGSIAVEIAPLFALAEGGQTGPSLLVGTAVSAGLLLAGVRLPGSAVMVVAALGLFGYLTGAILHYFGETVGAPLALLAGGALMLGVALVVTRLRRKEGPPL